jgi:archaellum component FlaC
LAFRKEVKGLVGMTQDDLEIQKIAEQLTNVRLDLRELSIKVDVVKDIARKVEEVESIAKKAMESTKSAHRRLDKIDKLISWLASTVIGAIILAVIGFIIKGGLNANP